MDKIEEVIERVRLTDEEIRQLLKETGWGIKRAESLNLVSNYRAVAQALLNKLAEALEVKSNDGV